MKKFIQELKRRNVIKASLAYLVITWVLLQVLQFLLPMINAPDWALKGITLIMAIGLPIWIIISWIYEITPEGIEKTAKDSGSELVTQATNKRLNAFIIISLSIAVIVMGLKLTNVFSSDSDKKYAIAVLPFEDMNMSNNPDDKLFIYGIAQDIHTSLSKIKGLIVVSDKTIKRYKDTDKTNPEIAKELGVNRLIRGKVRKYKNEVRVTAQLIDENDIQVWGDDYDKNIVEVFKIQRELVQEIVKELKIKLSPEEKEIIKRIPTENMEAYHLFLRGREFAVQRGGSIVDSISKGNLEKSIEFFKKAVELDSTYAEAYAEIAHSYYLLPLFADYDWEEYDKIAVSYLDKATELNSNLFRVYAVKAMLIQGEDWEKGGEYFEKSIALNPNDASVHMQYRIHLLRFRPVPDFEKGLEQIRIAQKLDPFVNQKNQQLFYGLLFAGEFEEAEELLNNYSFLFSKGSLLAKKANLKVSKNKDWTEAIRFYEAEIKKDPSYANNYKELGLAYDRILNDDDNFLKYAKKAYELDSTSSNIAQVYFNALTESKKFNEAKKLLQSKNFKSVRSKKQQLGHLWYYYYHQENYKKAQEVLNDSLMKYEYFSQVLTYAQLGDRKNLDNLMKKDLWNPVPTGKAFVYAILKERDSMYHYLGKMDNIFGIIGPNSRREFDPYRKEERYKAFLKKHYLPITHWNE